MEKTPCSIIMFWPKVSQYTILLSEQFLMNCSVLYFWLFFIFRWILIKWSGSTKIKWDGSESLEIFDPSEMHSFESRLYVVVSKQCRTEMRRRVTNKLSLYKRTNVRILILYVIVYQQQESRNIYYSNNYSNTRLDSALGSKLECLEILLQLFPNQVRGFFVLYKVELIPPGF